MKRTSLYSTQRQPDESMLFSSAVNCFDLHDEREEIAAGGENGRVYFYSLDVGTSPVLESNLFSRIDYSRG